MQGVNGLASARNNQLLVVPLHTVQEQEASDTAGFVPSPVRVGRSMTALCSVHITVTVDLTIKSACHACTFLLCQAA